jgi:hypothetical protein
MKSKVTKIFGVVVTVATLASMLVGFAVPANAALGTMDYGVVATPSNVGNVLGGSTSATPPVAIGDPNARLVSASADGKTVFVWDDVDKFMYKSTDGGVTFGKPVNIVQATVSACIDLKVSPNFATDKALVLIDNDEVWASNNGGTSYVSIISDLATKLDGGTITSMDIGNYYLTNTLNIIIGVTGGAGAFSNVLRYDTSSFAALWAEVGNIDTAGIGNFSVAGVRFSPNHMGDTEIMCVYIDPTVVSPTLTGALYFSSVYANLEWNAITPRLTLKAGTTALPITVITSADIAVASDYTPTSASPILVGVNGTGAGAAADDIYRITGRSPAAGASTDLDVGGTTTVTSVGQLVIGGAAAAAVILWSPAPTTINVTTGPLPLYRATGLVGTFTVVPPSKQPTAVTGSTSYPIWTSATTAICVVDGIDGGMSVSTDSGATWNQTALMNVGTLALLTLTDITVVDANTIFLVMGNATALYVPTSIFKTIDGGATWQRILTSTAAAANVDVIVSPAYATDTTLIVTDKTTILKKSTNGGASFTSLFQPSAVTTAIMVNGTDFYTGAANGFYKTGRFTNATGLTGVGDVFSIARNLKDATNLTFAIGTVGNSSVYQTTDGGVSFTRLGTAAVAVGSIYVTYGPDGTLYAAGSTSGTWKWTGTAWLDLGSVVQASGLVVGADGTMYIPDALATVALVTPNNGGIWRSLSPTAVNAYGAANVAFEQMRSATFPGFAAANTLNDIGIVSTATDNTLYVIETTSAAIGTYGYGNRILGIKDTFIVGPVITAPANNALLTTPTSATVTWSAIAGAPNTTTQTTNYALSTNTGSTFGGTAVAATYTAGDLTATHAVGALAPATKYYIRVKAIAPISSRNSTTFAFTTALNPVAPLATDLVPAQGGTGVSVNPTFSWPAVAGATGYEFVIAQETGQTDKFAIIDASSNIITNAYRHTEQLKYNTTYWWRVRPTVGDVKGDWKVFFFSTEAQPVEATATATTPPIIITTSPPPEITLSIPAQQSPVQVIPSYLLWAVVAVGAILVIAVIVLIVRTRRIS